MIATICAGYSVQQAKGHETPEAYFPLFLTSFLILFMCTGGSNGSVFRQTGLLFEPERRGPVRPLPDLMDRYGPDGV